MEKTLKMKCLLATLTALVMIDGFITNILINRGLTEGNPLLQPFVGGHKFILLKAFGAILCSLILWDIYQKRAKLALVSTFCLIVIYSVVVVWNAHLL